MPLVDGTSCVALTTVTDNCCLADGGTGIVAPGLDGVVVREGTTITLLVLGLCFDGVEDGVEEEDEEDSNISRAL